MNLDQTKIPFVFIIFSIKVGENKQYVVLIYINKYIIKKK